MRVEILEERLSSDGYLLGKGDTITVPDECGGRWCAAGWAKDVEGKVATGERRTDNIAVNPKKAAHKSAARVKGK
jgi:hypothetical protein